MNAIGEKLKEIRLLRDMSQRQLAEAAGLHEETIWNLENGKIIPQKRTVLALSSVLGVTVEELNEPCSGRDVHFLVFLDKGAEMPKRAHEDDAGFDLYSPKMDLVPRHGSTIIDTGVHVAIPKGYAGLIVSKSGMLFNHDIISDGLIDAGYTGSIHVKLFNLGDTSLIIQKGDKISQLVFVPIVEPGLLHATRLDETERGDGGFGSTGR